MTLGKLSGNDSESKGEIGVVIATIYEPGDVANVIYYSSTKPLALVPKSFYASTSSDAGISQSRLTKRTSRFRVGDSVEFELVSGSDRIVKWIRKSSDTINVFMSEEIKKFVAKSTGIIAPPNVKQDGLWTKEFGWVPLEPEQLRNFEPDVPMNVTILINISFGDHVNARYFKLEDFKPTCTYKLLSINDASDDLDFLHNSPWRKVLNLVSDNDSTNGSTEASLKAEDENSDQPGSSNSANSKASSCERDLLPSREIVPMSSTKRATAKKPCLNLIKADVLLGLGKCPEKLRSKIRKELLPRVTVTFDRNDWNGYFDSDDETAEESNFGDGDVSNFGDGDVSDFDEMVMCSQKWRRLRTN
ncbi:hypothetical protein DdX_14621 [Ditylenchus destructor]|uniref:Uncharacterized protein n=1 Tax=Ditylenchus destructor TaxID=166010 RepID=A0AAD4MSZ3_9BILA|nr:hypothetical protein DdX_14621 [Ditylenchus destructor]